MGELGGLGRLGEMGELGGMGAEIINKFFFWTLTYFLYFCRRLIRGAVTG